EDQPRLNLVLPFSSQKPTCGRFSPSSATTKRVFRAVSEKQTNGAPASEIPASRRVLLLGSINDKTGASASPSETIASRARVLPFLLSNSSLRVLTTSSTPSLDRFIFRTMLPIMPSFLSSNFFHVGHSLPIAPAMQ